MAEPSIQSKTISMAEGDRPFMTARRGVLKGFFGLVAALGLGSALYGLYRFLAPGGGTAAPVEIPMGDIPVGGSYTFQYGATPAIVILEEEGKPKAFSLVCTHMACTVIWNSEKKEFYCPCHDGFFDENGNVLSGPPPAPLERMRVELKGDQAWVGGA